MDNGNKKKDNFNFLEYSSIGFSFIFSILAGYFIGIYLDKLFNTKQVMTIIFLFLGIISGFANMIVIALKFGRKKK
ncbi:MAG: AtpZ/AtpI family protein [Spirochaetes bacterium]|nr:AtpZ/AtpI family protein [Spirochaetota bacterium]